MPELPEVETVRRGMEKALKGKRIKSATVRRHDLRVPVPENLPQILQGAIITDFLRRGKYIIWLLDAPQALVLHLGMSGRIRIYASGESCPLKKHDHIIIDAADGTTVVFNDPRRFGMLYSASAAHWAQQKPFISMGPEPLESWDGSQLSCALVRKKGPIKAALLDQSVVSGLGNIYVCEALYEAGISPLRPANTLSPVETRALVKAVKTVLEQAIAAGGSTLRDYQHTDGSLGYFQHSFRVYDRAQEKCPSRKCDSHIKRIIQSGRSTFYCPSCQK